MSIWEQNFALFPSIIEGKFIWLKNYYVKLERKPSFTYEGLAMIEEDYWDVVKITLNPTEYILFGEGSTNDSSSQKIR